MSEGDSNTPGGSVPAGQSQAPEDTRGRRAHLRSALSRR